MEASYPLASPLLLVKWGEALARLWVDQMVKKCDINSVIEVDFAVTPP